VEREGKREEGREREKGGDRDREEKKKCAI
jgi:hypothetical protein